MTNREIKFRAYSYKWDKMLYHGVDGYTIDVMNQTAWLDSACDQSVTLMEFTGLLDKNGKEIYEGDILQEKDRKNYRKIELYRNGFWSIAIHFDAKCPLTFFNSNIYDGYEVIGNIYETPELLK